MEDPCRTELHIRKMAKEFVHRQENIADTAITVSALKP